VAPAASVELQQMAVWPKMVVVVVVVQDGPALRSAKAAAPITAPAAEVLVAASTVPTTY
jgi:hypothetical protein